MNMSNQIITAIVAMNKDRVIGTNNQLPWHIPEDLKYFKEVTLNKPIIMGRKTFESIGRVLPNRRNIVISRSNFQHDGVEVFHSVEQALQALANEAEICIIGGGEIFKQTANIINSLHITEIDVSVENPCAWFPDIDLTNWEVKYNNQFTSSSGVNCKITHFVRINCKA